MNKSGAKAQKIGLILFGLASFCLTQTDQYGYDGTY
jgi:hypothetical protein